MSTTAQWEAEIFNEEETELIAWRPLPDSQVASAIAWLLGSDAEQEIEEDLPRFKSQMETGEVPTIKGQPSGGSN